MIDFESLNITQLQTRVKYLVSQAAHDDTRFRAVVDALHDGSFPLSCRAQADARSDSNIFVVSVIDRFFHPALPSPEEVHVDVALAPARAPVRAGIFEFCAAFALTPVTLSENENLGLETERSKLFCGDVFVRTLATTRDRASVREVRALGVNGPILKGVSDALADGSEVVELLVFQVGIARGDRRDRRQPRAHASGDVREWRISF